MKNLNVNELKNINGGGISSAFITAIVRGVNTILDISRSLGSAIRRIQSGNLCKF